MKTYSCSEKDFLDVVSRHKMTIIRDDGVNRHIRFRRKESSVYWFDLITWPGALCIDGDMGTFVFRRLEDMFEFFRTDQRYLNRTNTTVAINPSYWSEKLVAPTSRGVEEFNYDMFCQYVKEHFDSWVEENPSCSLDSKKELWKEIEDEVLGPAEDGEIRAHDSVHNFFSYTDETFNFADCWEWNCRDYKYHFIWCCYAIAWGIQTYDATKSNGEIENESSTTQ